MPLRGITYHRTAVKFINEGTLKTYVHATCSSIRALRQNPRDLQAPSLPNLRTPLRPNLPILAH